MTQDIPRLKAFPIFMRVDGEAVVIVGGGDEALAKARLLGQSSARLRVVAADAKPDLLEWIAANGAEHIETGYAPAHLDGAALVFAATGEESFDRRIAEDARTGRRSGKRRGSAGTLRLLHPGDRQPRAARRSDRHGGCGTRTCSDGAREDRPAAVAVARTTRGAG